ncbi:hypothetical protein EXU34_22200 [Alteromonas sp. ZYF713]|nr:hypothetical protein [Alteromonas sp. ZYF713]
MSKLSFSKRDFVLSVALAVLCALLLHFWGIKIIVSPSEASYEGRRSDLGAFITGFFGLAYGLAGIIFELIKPLLPRNLNEIWTKDLLKAQGNGEDKT